MARTITYTVSLGARGPAGPPGDGGGTTLTSYATQIESLVDYPTSFPNSDVTAATNEGTAETLVMRDANGSAKFGNTDPVSVGNTGIGQNIGDFTWNISGNQINANSQYYLPTGGNVITGQFFCVSDQSDGKTNLGNSVTGTLPLANGGTGAATAGDARTNLKVPASDPTGVSGADAVSNIITLTQAEYDAIGTPDASTLYVIV